MIARFVLALALVVATGASAETLRLAHHYKVSGTSPDGSKYSGTVTIDVTSDTTFDISWNIAGTAYRGFGMRQNDVLATAFTSKDLEGLAMYKVDGDELDGTWTVKGEDGSGTEHLTPVN